MRITTNTRFNFGSGKGAIDADISYPIDRLIGGNLNFYLIGQAFTGYGENLLDYNRRMTRLRLGLAIVRLTHSNTSEPAYARSPNRRSLSGEHMSASQSLI